MLQSIQSRASTAGAAASFPRVGERRTLPVLLVQASVGRLRPHPIYPPADASPSHPEQRGGAAASFPRAGECRPRPRLPVQANVERCRVLKFWQESSADASCCPSAIPATAVPSPFRLISPACRPGPAAPAKTDGAV
jgi:hypothetical protein